MPDKVVFLIHSEVPLVSEQATSYPYREAAAQAIARGEGTHVTATCGNIRTKSYKVNGYDIKSMLEDIADEATKLNGSAHCKSLVPRPEPVSVKKTETRKYGPPKGTGRRSLDNGWV